MALHKIVTISQFTHTYFIEAESLEHALDEYTMKDSGSPYDYFEEASQEFIGEMVLSSETIKRKHFDKWLAAEREKGSKSGASHWLEDKDLIRTVNYEDRHQRDIGEDVFRFMGTDLILGTPDIGQDD